MHAGAAGSKPRGCRKQKLGIGPQGEQEARWA